MYSAFVKLLNMSAAASALIVVVALLRLILPKMPKRFLCILWALVALRLICPVSISSAVSAFNFIGNSSSSGQVEYIHYNEKPEKPQAEIYSYISTQDHADGPTVVQHTSAVYLPTVMNIWLAGAACMILYALLSYGRVRRTVREAVRIRRNLYICDHIPSPFILGIFHPRIYLPSDLDADQQRSVVAHERAHIARMDHWWKPLGYGILCIHWFNPMVWLAYILFCRDMEMACDEQVIRNMTAAQKQLYSTVLLTCSMPRKTITACPLAFGEAGIKTRIKRILRYKKPTFLAVCLTALLCIVLAVCFLTNPKKQEPELYPLLSPFGRQLTDGYTLSPKSRSEVGLLKDGQPIGGIRFAAVSSNAKSHDILKALGTNTDDPELEYTGGSGTDSDLEFWIGTPHGNQQHFIYLLSEIAYDLWVEENQLNDIIRAQIVPGFQRFLNGETQDSTSESQIVHQVLYTLLNSTPQQAAEIDALMTVPTVSQPGIVSGGDGLPDYIDQLYQHLLTEDCRNQILANRSFYRTAALAQKHECEIQPGYMVYSERTYGQPVYDYSIDLMAGEWTCAHASGTVTLTRQDEDWKVSNLTLNMQEATEPTARVEHQTAYENGNRIETSRVAADGGAYVITAVYDAENHMIRRESSGRVQIYSYNASGYCTGYTIEDQQDIDSTAPSRYSYEYGPNGLKSTTIDFFNADRFTIDFDKDTEKEMILQACQTYLDSLGIANPSTDPFIALVTLPENITPAEGATLDPTRLAFMAVFQTDQGQITLYLDQMYQVIGMN